LPKTAAWDADAIGAAVTWPPMRLGPITMVELQDLQALQRGRSRLIKARTALVSAGSCRAGLHGYGDETV